MYAFTFFIRQALMLDVFKDLTGLGLWTMRIKSLIFFFFRSTKGHMRPVYIVEDTLHIIQRPSVIAAGMHVYRLYVQYKVIFAR